MFQDSRLRLVAFGIAFLVSSFGTTRAHASVISSGTFSPKESPGFRVARRSAFQAKLGDATNESCVKANVTYFFFEEISKYLPDTNYCEFEEKNLPKDVVVVLEKIADTNAKIAALLGQDVADTFPMSVAVTVSSLAEDGTRAHGSLDSESRGGQVFMTSLPDWSAKDFSPKLYAHEIVHTLTFNDGPTARALFGLRQHPFLIEAFPDLVAATIFDSPKMELGEPGLPGCLRTLRDETPLHSLNGPFSRFYPLAGGDGIVSCCATLDVAKLDPFAKSLCEEFTNGKSNRLEKVRSFIAENGIVAQPYDVDRLKAPFEAESCRITTATGLTYLDNCDAHQFGYPLVSFFFRLKELTGRSTIAASGRPYVTEFFAKIREGADRAAIYECGYVSGGVKAHVGLRPLLGAFTAFRDVLASSERSAFDRAWGEHDFGKLIDLDRIYRNEMLPGLAQLAVRDRNPSYPDLGRCESPYQFDASVCGVSCEEKP